MSASKSKSNRKVVVVAVIVLLSIALIAAGIYFNPFKQSNSSKTNNAKSGTPASEVALSETAFDESGTKFAFKYPKTWKLSHNKTVEGENSAKTDINIVTSPDNNTSVMLSVMYVSGNNSTCKSATNSIKVVETADIEKLPDYGFVQYTENDTKSFYVGAYNIKAAEGKTDCLTYENARYLLGKDESKPYVTMLSNVVNDTKTDNYKIAKRIIQSLYKKN